MVSDSTPWPRKTRELHNVLLDSSVWNEFRFRPDDVVIATYAKAGTTWTQQIVAQLIFGGQEGIDVPTLSPWLDMRFAPKEVKLAAVEAQQHRRFIKTHLPVDALVFSPDAKYIYVGRDGRDVVWSFYNHHANVTEEWRRMINDLPGRVGPPLGRPPDSIRRYFLDWLEGDGHPIWSFWDNVSSWWAIRHLPNVLFLHFGDLKRDLPGEMRRVAAFLDITLDDEAFNAAVRHSSFDYMKAHAERSAPHGGRFFKGGARTFIHKGTNGRWRDVLSAEDCHRYEATAEQRLGRPCARWLAEGGPIDQGLEPEASPRREGPSPSSGPPGVTATDCGRPPRIQHWSRTAEPRPHAFVTGDADATKRADPANRQGTEVGGVRLGLEIANNIFESGLVCHGAPRPRPQARAATVSSRRTIPGPPQSRRDPRCAAARRGSPVSQPGAGLTASGR